MNFESEELWTSICYNLFDPIKSPTYFWLWVICQQRSFRGVAIYNEWFCGDACNCHARSFLLSKFSSSWMTSSIHYMQTEISKRISISRVYMRFIKYTNLHQKCKRDLNQIFSHHIKNRKVSSKLSKLFENCLKCRFWILNFGTFHQF